jgi:4-alpha-glucanotransferase
MKLHFYLRYRTQYGEKLTVVVNGTEYLLECLNEDYWHGTHAFSDGSVQWQYRFYDAMGRLKEEQNSVRQLRLSDFSTDYVTLLDYWMPLGAIENTFTTQPFKSVFLKKSLDTAAQKTKKGTFTHVFRVKAPLLQDYESVCLLGHGTALRAWDTLAPLLMREEGDWWTLRLDLSDENFPLSYKYGIWNHRENRLTIFEQGSNRPLYIPVHNRGAAPGQTILHDGFIRTPLAQWRGAGVAIPVFSLRTEYSFGTGEFTDMKPLADWAKSVGLRLLQLLPVNDTSATGRFTDSYPYAAISAFALHPLYLNVSVVAGRQHASVLKGYAKKQKALNALETVDYEAVMRTKWEIIRQLYPLLKKGWQQDRDWLAYYAENKHWLAPYAAFCYLRDLYGTSDFHQWKTHHTYRPEEAETLLKEESTHYDDVAIHLFVQYHLHLQLREATTYAHQNGLAVKGDIPIGIYRYSCDAWVAPELYNMDQQAGAPPDDFAVAGQNWGFPTYNWARMKQDGFAWWRQRFEQMSLYFDAFRIDHILGFFRIWSIPLDAVEGILGQFIPAIPVTETELKEAGVGFEHERLCKPFITDQILIQTFGEKAAAVCDQFLAVPSGTARFGKTQYVFQPAFDTQRKVESWYARQEDTPENAAIRDGLYSLHSNVVLLDLMPGGYSPGEEWKGAFRIAMEKTSSFQALDPAIQGPLQSLYINYFFRRQDAFWQQEAMEKLPALKRSTNMLICGEDLGMVPACVPDVMKDLGILSLEIQRMPKALGAAFLHPKDTPYLSVVTPSTHDMSTLRGWWEEDRGQTQRFYNEILGQPGQAPYYCEPWINRMLIEQHLYAPAMWAIFQLQDLLGSDGQLRRENPADERINIPANPKHYWRYRMHLSLEALMQAREFNEDLKRMVRNSGRRGGF